MSSSFSKRAVGELSLWCVGSCLSVSWYSASPIEYHPSLLYIFLQTNWHSIQHGYMMHPEFEMSMFLGSIIKAVSRWMVRRAISPYPCTSHCGWLPDFVHPFSTPKTADSFIDGDHRYQTVVDDLRLWSPKVAPGGCSSGCCWSAMGHVEFKFSHVHNENCHKSEYPPFEETHTKKRNNTKKHIYMIDR